MAAELRSPRAHEIAMLHPTPLRLFLSLLALTPVALTAQVAELVKDINKKPVAESSVPDEYTLVVDGTKRLTFFVAQDGKVGRELWVVTNGAPSSTRVVRDIRVGVYGSHPHHLTAVGNRLYFFANDGRKHGLWVTDGTLLGTSFVTAVVQNVKLTIPYQNKLYYTVGESNTVLYSSDGTATGTVNVISAKFLDGLAVNGDQLFFMAAYNSVGVFHDVGLFATNTSGKSPQLMRRHRSNTTSWPKTQLVSAGRKLFYALDGGNLWRSEGTAATTFNIAAMNVFDMSELKGKLVFSGFESTAIGFELYESDGTANGTKIIKDIAKNGGSAKPANLTTVGTNVYFTTASRGLWGSDGTANGTRLVRATDAQGAFMLKPTQLFNSSGVLLFLAGTSELWRSDGTFTGTYRLRKFLTNNINVKGTWAVIGRTDAIFTATDRINGDEPWVTDGTAAGTKMLRNIAGVKGATFSSGPKEFQNLNGELWFTAADGIGGRLMRSDGTDPGTVSVTGPLSASGYDLTVMGNKLFFVHFYGNNGWRLSCLEPGKSIANLGVINPSELTAGRRYLYFKARHATLGSELWRTDGTVVGTQVVKDIHPVTHFSDPRQMTLVGDTMYFVATDGARGRELWKTDGSEMNTMIVKDIALGPASANIGNLTAMDGVLYFTAQDGTHGTELWRSDGSRRGTYMLKDIAVGSNSSNVTEMTPAVNAVGAKLFFFANSGPAGQELWVTDGTSGGTVMVKDIRPGYLSSVNKMMVALGGRVLFAADDGVHGQELWTSTGTALSTRMVKDIWPGKTAGMYPNMNDWIIAVGSRWVYFVAQDGQHGFELWRTNGKAATTTMVRDIRKGGEGSVPHNLMVAGGSLFFAADDGVHGVELWRVQLGAVSTPVGGGRTFGVTDGVLGGTSTIWHRGLPSKGTKGLAMLGAPTRSPVQMQGQWVYFDMRAPLPLHSFSTNGSSWNINVNIPNDASLMNVELVLQPGYERRNQLYIDNAVRMKLGR